MTAQELIDELQDSGMDLDLPIHFAYNYGDHWNTEVAPEVGSVDGDNIIKSPYHNCYKTVEETNDDDGSKEVIILRAR